MSTNINDPCRAIEGLLPSLQRGLQDPEELLNHVVHNTRQRSLAEDIAGSLAPDRLQTGLPDLDALINGLGAGEVLLVAGVPGTGRTSLGINLMEHIGIKQSRPSIYFSPVLAADNIQTRLIGSLGRIPYHRIFTGQVKEELEAAKFDASVGMIAGAPRMLIDDTPHMNVNYIDATIKQKLQPNELGLAVIDDVQALNTPVGADYDNSASLTLQALRNTAIDTGVAMVLNFQLPLLDRHPKPRPTFELLNSLVAAERHADTVVLLYRDEIYDPESLDKGIVEMTVAKSPYVRRVLIDTIRTAFLDDFGRFERLQCQF